MNIDEATTEILDKLHLNSELVLSKSTNLLCIDLIQVLLITSSIKEASEILLLKDSTLEHILSRKFKQLCNKTTKNKWGTHLLSIIEHKKCRACNNILPFNYYSINKLTDSDKNSICKKCGCLKSKEYRSNNVQACKDKSLRHYINNKSSYLAKNANRRALKLNATPSWANLSLIKEIYNSCPEGYHVDHIVPLQGKLVCGLHVENNLQHLLAVENMQKHNKFIGE